MCDPCLHVPRCTPKANKDPFETCPAHCKFIPRFESVQLCLRLSLICTHNAGAAGSLLELPAESLRNAPF